MFYLYRLAVGRRSDEYKCLETESRKAYETPFFVAKSFTPKNTRLEACKMDLQQMNSVYAWRQII
jgi:hypothetical protein